MIWKNLTEKFRKKLVWTIWFWTWLLLLAGLINQNFYVYVVILSLIHTLLFMYMFDFQIKPFPVQLRLAYLTWTIIGTYVPGMLVLMYISTIGLAANLFLKYCPLARMIYLLPWNREEDMSLNFIKRVFFSPPMNGQFKISAGK